MEKQHLDYLKLIETQLRQEGDIGIKHINQFGVIISVCEAEQTLSPAKEKVYTATETAWGKVTPDNFRTRLKILNGEFKENNHGILLSSSKHTIDIGIENENIEANLAQQQIIAKFRQEEIDTKRLVEPKASQSPERLPVKRAFFSYSRAEDKKELATQHKFANMLARALKNPPATLRSDFIVELYIDQADFKLGENIYDMQDKACENIPLAIVCYTHKYLDSPFCQQEINFYLDKKGNHYKGRLAIPLPFDCKFDEMETRYQKNLTLTKDDIFSSEKYLTIAHLFEKEDTAEQKDLIKRLVKAIYQWYAKNPNPPKYHDLNKEAILSANRQYIDNTVKHEHLNATPKKTENTGINIVEHMREWAIGKAEENTRLFYLLGDFGAGKSTTCQMLAQRLMQDYEASKSNQPVLPIYLDLKVLLDAFDSKTVTGQSIEKLLEVMLSKSSVAYKVDGQSIIQLIQNYPCLVIFDGFDEVGHKLEEQQQSALLNQLVSIFPNQLYQRDLSNLTQQSLSPEQEAITIPDNSRIIISCRTHFFEDYTSQKDFSQLFYRHQASVKDGEVQNFQTYYLLPLTAEQIRNYLTQWFGEEKSQQAIDFIQSVHDLSGLSEKPLMLNHIRQLLPKLEEHAKTNPHVNAATLYQQLFFDVMGRDNAKHIINKREKSTLLKVLAHHLWTKGKNRINVAELNNWFLDHYEDYRLTRIKINSGSTQPEVVLQDLHNASLLVRADDNNYQFAHTSFYEYFLGCYLLDALIEGTDLKVADREVNRETILFCTDQAEQSQQLDALKNSVTQILQSKENDTPLRALAVRLWRVWDSNLSNPPANSVFDDLNLQDLKFSDGDWQGISAKHAQLNGLDVKKSRFDGVEFDGTVLANSYFNQCHFSTCKGAPISTESAHLWHNEIDESSKSLFKDSPFYWQTSDTLHDRPSPIIRSQQDTDSIQHAVFSSFSSNGQYLLTAEGDIVRLWDAKTTKYLKTFSGHTGTVNSAVFSSDSLTIVTASSDGTAKVFDINTAKCLNTFEGHKYSTDNVFFSNDKKMVLATSCIDDVAKIFDVKTEKCLKTFEVVAAVFSQDNRTVLTVSCYGNVKVFDVKTAKYIDTSIPLEYDDRPTCAVFSNDDNIVLIGYEGKAKAYDTKTWKCLNTFEGLSDTKCAIFSHDNRTVSIATNYAVKTFDTKTAECLKTFEPPFAIKIFLNDSDTFLVTYYNKVKAFDADTGQCLKTFEKYSGGVMSATFSNDNKTVLTIPSENPYDFSRKSVAKLFDAQTAQCLNTFDGHSDSVNSAVFSNDNQTILTASYDNTAKIFDTKTGKCIKTFEGHGLPNFGAFFSNDNKSFLTICGGIVKLFDVQTKQCIKTFEASRYPINSAVFSHDDCSILLTSNDNATKIFDVNTGQCLVTFGGRLEHEDYLNRQHDIGAYRKKRKRSELTAKSSVFSNDSTKILMTTSNDGIKILDIETEEYLKTFEDKDSSLSNAIFSHDNCTILAISDNKIKIFDTETTQCIKTFTGHTADIRSAEFSQDDSKILTASSDNTVRIWSAETGEVLTIMHQFKDASAITDAEGNILHHDGDIWRYAIGLVDDEDGFPQVVCPKL